MNDYRDILCATVESGIQQALALYETQSNGDMLSDLSIRIDRENGKLLVYDDLENLWSESILETWGDSEQESTSGSFIKTLKHILHDLNKQSVFDKDFIFKPFSVNLVDENFGQIEELLFLDGNTIKLDGGSLLNLDKELSGFLKHLLND
ncbi:MAG: hypothetical protein LBC40_04350 [Dysgonamonadaceae bacterium]|jgi:hypothetical protein|nr:hypothetical protein [Dysgonamonadaceae bacterium]